MQSLKETSKRLLEPFRAPLRVALIGDKELYCNMVQEMIDAAFEANGSVLEHIGNVTYSREESLFKLVIHREQEISFFVDQIVSVPIVSDELDRYDLVFRVMDFARYAPHEYNGTGEDTEQALRLFEKAGKSSGIVYLHMENLCVAAIAEDVDWERTTNEAYRIIRDGVIENEPGMISPVGKEILKGLYKVFNYYSRGQRKFETVSRINFLTSGSQGGPACFGQLEFMANLLIRLASLDKLNAYHYET